MVEIVDGVEILDLSLYIIKEKILIIGDLHLGIENSLINQGILIPKFQFDNVKENIKKILDKHNVKKIILNGDIKHEFSKINAQEWKDVYLLIDFLEKYCQVEIVIGNHDYVMKKNLELNGYRAKYFLSIGDIMVLHGDFIPEEVVDKKIIIIGHEHPSVLLKEGAKAEKFKCFMKGKWKNKILIVMPSFNPLNEGTDILSGEFLSPFLTESIDDFELFIIGDKVYNFGKVRNLT